MNIVVRNVGIYLNYDKMEISENINGRKRTLKDVHNQTEEGSALADGSEGLSEVDLAMGISVSQSMER